MRGRLSIYAWPIWLKIAIGFTVVLLILAIPALTLIRSGVVDIAIQSARSSLVETGAVQLNALETSITDAESRLYHFMASPATYNLASTLLNNQTEHTQEDINYFQLRVRNQLLSDETPSYTYIRLVDTQGNVITFNTALGIVFTEETNLSESGEAFYAFRYTQQQMSTAIEPVLSIFNTPDLEINYSYPILSEESDLLGYLIATFDVRHVVYPHLSTEPYEVTTQAFLLKGYDIVTPPAVDPTTISYNREIITLARVTPISSNIAQVDETGYIAFFGRVLDTPLLFMAQTPTETAISQALSQMTMRTFIVVLGMVAGITVILLLFNQLLVPPLVRLRNAALGIGRGDYSVEIADYNRLDEVGTLASAMLGMRDSVKERITHLQNQVADLSRDISVTQDLSRIATNQRTLQDLLDRSVELIVERFDNIYHAQIFLLNDERTVAVLQSSTGEAGRILLSRGHRIEMGSVSVIGQVTEGGHIVHAQNTSVSAVHRRNEFLPETKDELAIPLRNGEIVIGALDVQSKLQNAFSEEDINILQIMADQITIAIQNLQLQKESVTRQAEIESVTRQTTLDAWRDFANSRRQPSLSAEVGQSIPEEISDLRAAAVRTNQIMVGEQTERNTIPVAIPLTLRGQVLGAIEWELPAQSFGQDKLDLARELANRIAISLDNARLFRESQRATEREHLISEIAATLTSQTSIDGILSTAVREVGQALRAPRVSIRLRGRNDAISNPIQPNGNHQDNGHTENGHSPDSEGL